MNVLQLISSLGFFGAENVLVQLAGELYKNPECTPVSGVIKNIATPHLEVIEACLEKGIESVIFSCRSKFDFKTIITLRKYVKSRHINIIHSHGYKADMYSYFAALGLPVKRIATCHNWLGDDPKMKFYAALDKFFLRNFSHVVAVSVDVQKQLLQSSIPSSHVSLIKNGVDIDRFAMPKDGGNLKSALGISPDNLVIGTVGRISVEKGHRHLLNIADDIEKECPGTTFLVVGDGDLRPKLQNEFDQPNIIFTGLRNDLPALYACMDIFVLPSLTEGLPMVLLEAMASRLPVVASDVGFISHVVEEGMSGFLVAPGDEQGLKDRLMQLLKDSGQRTSMGEKGFLQVKKEFSSMQMAREYISVYRKAMRGQ